MRVQDIMSRHVVLAAPQETIREAAEKLARIDAGVLPVGENDRLVGMLTDRDITVRAVAAGRDPNDCTVQEVMSTDIKYIFEDESTSDLARNFSDLQLRRMPVLSRDKRLVGIVALGDLATGSGGEPAKDALQNISEDRS